MYENQLDYFREKIMSNPEWQFAEIIGTQTINV